MYLHIAQSPITRLVHAKGIVKKVLTYYSQSKYEVIRPTWARVLAKDELSETQVAKLPHQVFQMYGALAYFVRVCKNFMLCTHA